MNTTGIARRDLSTQDAGAFWLVEAPLQRLGLPHLIHGDAVVVAVCGQEPQAILLRSRQRHLVASTAADGRGLESLSIHLRGPRPRHFVFAASGAFSTAAAVDDDVAGTDVLEVIRRMQEISVALPEAQQAAARRVEILASLFPEFSRAKAQLDGWLEPPCTIQEDLYKLHLRGLVHDYWGRLAGLIEAAAGKGNLVVDDWLRAFAGLLGGESPHIPLRLPAVALPA